MKIGISANYILNGNVEAGAEAMRQYGYKYCDYRHFMRQENVVYTMTDEELECKLVSDRDILLSKGIKVNQVHGLWQWEPNDFLAEDREMKFVKMVKGIKGSATLGAEYFVLHPFMPFGGGVQQDPAVVYEVNREMFTRLADVGKEYGVVICLENMPFPKFPLSSVKAVTDFVKDMDHPYLKVCLDTGHALICAEEPADAARYVGKDLLATLHVHDNFGVKDEHLLPGKGAIKWQAFADALAEIGFDGVFSFETGIWGYLEPDERLKQERALYQFAEDLVGHI